MIYLVVHATGTDYDYVSTATYTDAVTTYTDWLSDYATAARDRFARNQVDSLRAAGEASRGRVVEYRPHSYGNTATPEQVFVLRRLDWPGGDTWKIPSADLDRDWGKSIHHLDYNDGAFELRTDDSTWRIYWLDKHAPKFTTTESFPIGAEAAAVFAFIDAFVKAHS
jgi:hypothetical protein